MKEAYLQNSFEFGTQLMNKLTVLKENEYRCISCNYNNNENSDYKFNFDFTSSKTKNKIKFSYHPTSESEVCYFDVNIETAKGDNIELKKSISANELYKINLFYCDTYEGNFSDKVFGFIKKIDNILKLQLNDL